MGQWDVVKGGISDLYLRHLNVILILLSLSSLGACSQRALVLSQLMCLGRVDLRQKCLKSVEF
jgi:hypothetical protein